MTRVFSIDLINTGIFTRLFYGSIFSKTFVKYILIYIQHMHSINSKSAGDKNKLETIRIIGFF